MPIALPPYFDINPDMALNDLGKPVGSAAFATLATVCGRGSKARSDDTPPPLRLFSSWEITRYLIPVAVAHFRRVLKANPTLPQGRSGSEAGARWFTLEEVQTLRRHFDTAGSKAKEYRPYRPAGLPARITAVANAQAGAGKTTTTVHLAMAAALDGYRVLAIDLDPQGGLSTALDRAAADQEDESADGKWRTAFALIARHHVQFQQAENQRRLDRGDAPLPLDESLGAAAGVRTQDLIRPTRWPGIDLIGADLTLCRAEVQVPDLRLRGRGWRVWDALRDTLSADGVLEDYDVVLIDTASGLGQLALAGLATADLVLVPTRVTPDAFTATGRYFDMLATTFRAIEADQNTVARALGRSERSFSWQGVRAVLTCYDATRQAGTAAAMLGALGPALSPHPQEASALLGPDGVGVAGIYDIDYRDINREAYVQGRTSFDAAYAAFKTLLIGAWYSAEETQA